ncbi:MAG: asparaginase [Bacteroidales bacterium]|nr:asparaginase [Bacteroidales bacterium]
MIKNLSSLLLIYTGGTIGMKVDPADGALKPFDFSQILSEVPEILKFACKIDVHSYNPLIDSSDVETGLWVSLVELIKENYDKYDGFVILHGTDTMAYTASAVSFMLENLSKAVVFTGSQLPIGVPRTDGRENLISAIEIASAHDENGHSIVPEVSIFFAGTLVRANRATKINAEEFSAFRSYNYPPLATAGVKIRYNHPAIHSVYDWGYGLEVSTKLDTRVSILKIHPAITESVARNVLLAEGCRAVIIETYGSGNAPSKGWFISLVQEAIAKGKIIVNKTQCLGGSVDMNIYEGGRLLLASGVVSAGDTTTEATLAKLFYLMGLYEDNDMVTKAMAKSLRGELS